MRRFKSRMVVLAFLFIFVVYGCSSFTGSSNDINNESKSKTDEKKGFHIGDKQIVIGLSLGTLKEERWVNEKEYFELEAGKNGAMVVARDAHMDENVQKKQIDELIRQKVDALVIVPVNKEKASKSIALAKKAGIPVLAYSRMINDADIDAFIGFDVLSIGKDLARSAVERVPKGNYMIINGSSVDNNAKLEQEGYYSILKSYIDKREIQVVFEDWCDNWSPEQALTATEKGLAKCNCKVDAVLVSNDGMAGGVVEALKKHGVEGKVFVTGTDGELAACRRIVAGTQSVTMLFPQKEFAEEAARAAISLANNLIPADATGRVNNKYKDVPTIFARTILVNRYNLKEVLQQSGLHKIADVYKNASRGHKPH